MLSQKIQTKVMKNMDRSQQEYYLREQIKVMQDELGRETGEDDDATQWLKKLDELQLEEKTDAKIRKEIQRFAKMPAMSPDANVSRTYIETILELPWHEASKTNINIKRAEKILNEDHYGLEKVKERILEHLAVMHLTKSIQGPILCLVGPPGVGKTSIARSIARATNREFIRMSLGAFGTKRKFGDTVALTWVPFPDESSTASARWGPTIRCSCWMRWISWEMISGEIRHLHCWRCWIRNRTRTLRITIWKSRSICPM